MDPYKYFELPKSTTDVDLVKRRYKELVFKHHPDRSVDIRTSEAFIMLTACYKKIVSDIRLRLSDRSFDDLRAAYNSFASQQQNETMSEFAATNQRSKPSRHTPQVNPKNQTKPGDSRFDTEEFNRIFEANKTRNVFDSGYDKWMDVKPNSTESTTYENDYDALMANKINLKNKRNTNKHALIKYIEPEALYAGSTAGFMSLGVSKIDDWSADNTVSGALHYTDYKIAHTTDKLVDEKFVTPRKEYKTVGELEADRAKISFTLSPQDVAREQRKTDKLMRENVKMKELIRKQDEAALIQYNNVQKHAMRLR